MQVLMRHPEHGATHAYNNGQVEELIAKGWVVDAPAPTPRPVLTKPKRADK